MLKNQRNLFLILVVLLFLATRLYKITEIPPSLYWDEASIGYNAHSIVETGKDEWGKSFPLHFRAFGEFKLPVYIYSVAVFEKIFGDSELSVRFPAVFYALGIVILTYLLSLRIFRKDSIAIFSAFFLTITPWFFIFSRTGYEAVAGLAFYLFGMYLFLLRSRGNVFVILSTLSFIVTLYSYNSFRIIAPITLVALFVHLLQKEKQNLRKVLPVIVLSIFLFSAGFFPIFRLMTRDAGTSRLQAVGIFSKTQTPGETVREFSTNFISHFSPDFLLVNGDKNLRSQQQGFGQLSWVQFLLFVAGLIFIFKKRQLTYIFPAVIVLISVIPAAITNESPHALRSITVVPFLAMISAFGAVFIGEKLKKGLIIQILIVIIALGFFGFYYKSFIVNYPASSSEHWQYPYKIIFTQNQFKFENYDKVIISDSYAQPYIFALYYLRYNPNKFWSDVEYNPVDKWGFSTVRSFDKFIFIPVSLENLPSGKLLIFATEKEHLGMLAEKGRIKNLDGRVAFYVYEYQNE